MVGMSGKKVIQESQLLNGYKGDTETMAKYVTNGNISIGYEMFTDIRKKPCIVVKQGNTSYILGTFSNMENADFFIEKLAEMTSAKESEKK